MAVIYLLVYYKRDGSFDYMELTESRDKEENLYEQYSTQIGFLTRPTSSPTFALLPICPFWVNIYTSSFVHAVHASVRARTIPRSYAWREHAQRTYIHTSMKQNREAYTHGTEAHLSADILSPSNSFLYPLSPFHRAFFPTFWHFPSLSPPPSSAPVSIHTLMHTHPRTYTNARAQLSRSFSWFHYSLADNLAELVNLVEENLVVRHSGDEEVEDVDRTRRLYAPKGASELYEFVIIRKPCKYAPLFSRSLGWRRRVSCRAVCNTAAAWAQPRIVDSRPPRLLPTLSSPSISFFRPTATILFSSTHTLRTYTHLYVHKPWIIRWYTRVSSTPGLSLHWHTIGGHELATRSTQLRHRGVRKIPCDYRKRHRIHSRHRLSSLGLLTPAKSTHTTGEDTAVRSYRRLHNRTVSRARRKPDWTESVASSERTVGRTIDKDRPNDKRPDGHRCHCTRFPRLSKVEE